MPKFEGLQWNKALPKNQAYALSVVVGPERYIARQYVEALRGKLGVTGAAESFDLSERTLAELLDEIRTPFLWGGKRLITVQGGAGIKDWDELLDWAGTGTVECSSVSTALVFFMEAWDAKRKPALLKQIQDKSAWIVASSVEDRERAGWIDRIAERVPAAGALSEEERFALVQMEPWSLERVEQELEKRALYQLGGGGAGDAPPLDLWRETSFRGEELVECLLARKKVQALRLIEGLAAEPEGAMLFQGLLTWNVKQLVLRVIARETGERLPQSAMALPGFVLDRLDRWSQKWTRAEIERFQGRLAQIDLAMKQSPATLLGLWGMLVLEG